MGRAISSSDMEIAEQVAIWVQNSAFDIRSSLFDALTIRLDLAEISHDFTYSQR